MRHPRLTVTVLAVAVVAAFALAGASAPSAQAELTGTLINLHGDDFANGVDLKHGPDLGQMVDTGTDIVKVTIPGNPPLGEKVHLRGNYVKTDGGNVFVATSAEPVNAGGSSYVPPGPNVKVAVILFNFTNNRSTPTTPAAVRGVMFDNPDSVSSYYRAASNGGINITGDVFGWYPLNVSNATCDLAGWRSGALAAAAAAGVNLSGYQYVMFGDNSAPSCPFTGSASMPGTNSWINGSFAASTMGHELGHNFGMDHASAWTCTAGGVQVTVSDSCTSTEYGDTFDMMGSGGIRMLNDWHLAQLGWLNGKQTVTANGNYTIGPLDDSSSPRLLRIPRPDGTFLQLEFRRPSGTFGNFQPDWPVVNGVTLRVAPDDQSPIISRSWLLDATPETPTFWDSALPVGRTFNDVYGSQATHVAITTVAVSPAGATVNVQFAVPPPPTTTTKAPATTTTTKPASTTTTKPPVTTTTKPSTTTTTKAPTPTTPPAPTQPPTPPPPTGALVGQTAFVQHVATGTKSQAGNASLTLVVPPGSATTAGHRIIVTAGVGTFAGNWSCSDSRGNQYTLDGLSSARNLFVCSANLSTALQAGDTITVNYPGFSGVSSATAAEFAGIAPVGAVDGGSHAGSSTSTKTVSVFPSVTTGSANDLLFAAVGSTTAFAADNGFTGITSFGGVSTAFRPTIGTGTFTQFGSVVSGAWRALLVPYRAA